MVKRGLQLMACGFMLALISPLAAPAQVDYRVNQTNASRDGRALDANPGVGTGGLNQPGPRTDPGGYAGAVISGNVTGLARFQGYSPVLSSNQFRATLPSSALSGFQGQSVGVQDVWANRTLSTTPYYDTQRTISDVGFIRAGLNAPGSSQLASPYITPPAPTAPPPAGSNGQIPAYTDRRLDSQLNLDRLGMIQQTPISTAPQSSSGIDAIYDRYRATMDSSIFGMPKPTTPRGLQQANGLDPLRRGVQDSRDQETAAQPSTGGLGTGPDGNIATLLEQSKPSAAASLTPRPATIGTAPGVGAAAFPRREVPAGGSTGAAPSGPGELGQDRFTDLLKTIQTAQQLGIQQLGFQAPSGRGQSQTGGVQSALRPQTGEDARQIKAPSPARPLQRSSEEGVAQLAAAAKWASDLLEDPLKTFAGKYGDRANQWMAAGEEALRKGEYYRAADLFELAQTVAPDNPLPLLHRGHAQLAAGDYLSASYSLQQGIAKFPQIAAFRLDLPAMSGSQGVFDVRRADLERSLVNTDSYEMRFLLGYLELYSGLPEEGIRDLELAAQKAPPDSIISVFADLVTGRRELPAVREPSHRGP